MPNIGGCGDGCVVILIEFNWWLMAGDIIFNKCRTLFQRYGVQWSIGDEKHHDRVVHNRLFRPSSSLSARPVCAGHRAAGRISKPPATQWRRTKEKGRQNLDASRFRRGRPSWGSVLGRAVCPRAESGSFRSSASCRVIPQRWAPNINSVLSNNIIPGKIWN